PALRADSVAAVLRPASGTAVLHHRAARGGKLRRSPRGAHRPAARRARGRGGRRAGPVGSQEPASGPRHRARGRALPRRVAAGSRSLSDDSPETDRGAERVGEGNAAARLPHRGDAAGLGAGQRRDARPHRRGRADRSEEHTSELQSPCNLVCRLLLEKKNNTTHANGGAGTTAVTHALAASRPGNPTLTWVVLQFYSRRPAFSTK